MFGDLLCKSHFDPAGMNIAHAMNQCRCLCLYRRYNGGIAMPDPSDAERGSQIKERIAVCIGDQTAASGLPEYGKATLRVKECNIGVFRAAQFFRKSKRLRTGDSGFTNGKHSLYCSAPFPQTTEGVSKRRRIQLISNSPYAVNL